MKRTGMLIPLLCASAALFGQPAELAQCNVIWNSQSRNSAESMPCGGGDVGLNVWVENGELLFYMARSGTFDENNAMLKLGRIRLNLSPNPLAGKTFRQELTLADGSVKISGHSGTHSTDITLWVDVFSPAIHVEVESSRKVTLEAAYENWRFEDRPVRKLEGFGNSYKWQLPDGLVAKKDETGFDGNSVLFYHRNTGETVFDVTVRQQQLDPVKDQLFDPLKDLTFGGRMQGDNLAPDGTATGKYLSTPFRGWKLKSRAPSKTHRLDVYLHSGQYKDQSAWRSNLDQSIAAAQETAPTARRKTINWWADFWKRSFIFIDPENGKTDSPAWQAGRNYQLFRYLLGCNAYGEYPTKFNGGLFTVDPELTDSARAFSPDYRNWGGGTFTAQNQRLVYFPLLKSGDFDVLKPQLDFYARLLKNAELRSRVYWGHEGACFTEQIENFGLPNCTEYGWKRPEGYDPGMMYNAWLEYQWDTALECCWMALQRYAYQGEDISEYIPLIESCLLFFDAHYQYLASRRGKNKLDGDGRLILYPGSACETYKMAYNATSTIAALKTVTEGLLGLPAAYLDEEKREKWQAFLRRIPPVSYGEFEGHKTLAPAKLWERVNNTEAPQLYPVFPWGIYGIGKPDLDVAVNTYLYDPDVIRFRDHKSWKQYNIFAARLGLTDEARKWTVLKLQDSGRRFPAFWGPGFDWTPDHNWGGSGMIGLQEMLLQTNGDTIYLFPAWPKEWDVHFKLHAPGNTQVEAELKNGKAAILRVVPESRRKDIEILMN